MGKAKGDSIEHHLRDKETDSNSRANAQVESDFRTKYGKQNEIIEKNFELPSAEFVVDRTYIYIYIYFITNLLWCNYNVIYITYLIDKFTPHLYFLP